MPSSTKKKSYGAGWGAEDLEDLECPSGALCQVRKPSPRRVMMAPGFLEKFNLLAGEVQAKHINRVKGKLSAVEAKRMGDALQKTVEDDPSKIIQVMAMADQVVEQIVVQPAIRRPIKMVEGKEVPLDLDERTEGTIYTDMIDEMDRMFIMQYAIGGKPDLIQFRSELEEFDRTLGDGEPVDGKAV